MIGRSAADPKPKAAAEPQGGPEGGDPDAPAPGMPGRGPLADRLLVRILALFCLAILPVALLAGVIARRNDVLAVAAGQQAAAAAAAGVLAQARADLAFVDRSLIGLAALPAVQGADPAACRQALGDALAAAGGRYQAMLLVTSHGGGGCATAGSDAAPAAIAALARSLAAPVSGGLAVRSLGPGMLVAGRQLTDAAGKPALLVAMLRTDRLSPPPDALHFVQALWLVQPDGEAVALGGLGGPIAGILAGSARCAGQHGRRAGPQRRPAAERRTGRGRPVAGGGGHDARSGPAPSGRWFHHRTRGGAAGRSGDHGVRGGAGGGGTADPARPGAGALADRRRVRPRRRRDDAARGARACGGTGGCHRRDRRARAAAARRRRPAGIADPGNPSPGEEQPSDRRLAAQPASQPHPPALGARRIPVRPRPGARAGDPAPPPLCAERAARDQHEELSRGAVRPVVPGDGRAARPADHP